MRDEPRIGVDIGGTKLALGTLESVAVLPTPGTAGGIVEAILSRAQTQTEIGICVAGRVDLQQGMTDAAHLPQLRHFPLVRALSTGGRRIHLINDADAAALGEYRFGAARGVATCLYVTVSTGIGAGLVIQGQPYLGSRGQAVELGHAGGGPEHLLCPCGRRGCIDLVSSGTAIVREVRQTLGQPDLSAAAIAARAAQHDPLVLGVVRGAATQLGQVLANACVLFNPDVVVLGGGVIAGYGALYTGPLQRALQESLGHWSVPEIRTAQLGQKAGVLGALAFAGLPTQAV